MRPGAKGSSATTAKVAVCGNEFRSLNSSSRIKRTAPYGGQARRSQWRRRRVFGPVRHRTSNSRNRGCPCRGCPCNRGCGHPEPQVRLPLLRLFLSVVMRLLQPIWLQLS